MTHHQMSETERYLANEFQLRPREAQVLNLLREAVGYLPRHKISTNNKLASVHICKLRSKLRPRGIIIDTVRGGYKLAGDIRWQRVNDEPFEYAIRQGQNGDEFVKSPDGCLRRPLS